MHAPTGPYLLQAVLCEKVLLERDNVISLIRVVDRITHVESGPDTPDDMPAVTFPLTLFINLKPGAARGRHQVVLRLVKPNGEAVEAGRLPVHFNGGEDQGQNIQLEIRAEYQYEGLYWFEVFWNEPIDDGLMTRIPIRLVYQRNAFPAQSI